MQLLDVEQSLRSRFEANQYRIIINVGIYYLKKKMIIKNDHINLKILSSRTRYRPLGYAICKVMRYYIVLI